jgi:hypothetical protein
MITGDRHVMDGTLGILSGTSRIDRRGSRFECAAATRFGRAHRTSADHRTVASSCFGPNGNSSEKIGLVSSPASARSAL